VGGIDVVGAERLIPEFVVGPDRFLRLFGAPSGSRRGEEKEKK